MAKMLAGFGNVFQSECVPNALPRDQNNPLQVPFGLYTEQLSGTSFTRSRNFNRSIWMYRKQPSSSRSGGFSHLDLPILRDSKSLAVDPNPGRWGPLPADGDSDFVEGSRLFGQAGDPDMGEGLSIYHYAARLSMTKRSVSFHDGEVLLVPQHGSLRIRTEMGEIDVEPQQICVIPRGIKWSVFLTGATNEAHRGYYVEVYNEAGFQLPELGLIGANGLANPLHFEHPISHVDDTIYDNWENIIKLGGEWFHQSGLKHSPYDVVAWKGNYLPYRYDLRKFVAMNTVTVDHPDPSIFTVLTAPTSIAGVAACDFVIFPHRWMVAQHTFRPPYFHRNVMSEFMGLISGTYDGKKGGFVPGGMSLHNRLVPHGPDNSTFQAALSAPQDPIFFNGGLAFMFESAYLIKLSDLSRNGDHREKNYANCWSGLERAKM